MRWNAAARRAAQKISERNWRNEKPVSAAAELEQLSEELSEVKLMLTAHAAAARNQLGELAPAVSELAHRAAEATEQVQRRTRQLAQDIEKNEVPDPLSRLAGLERDVAELSSPLSDLREALVDRADAQDLLETREAQLARQADAAIDIVDRADAQTARSLDDVAASAADQQARELGTAAEQQADAAAALEQLAQYFAHSESLPAEATTAAAAAAQLAQLDAMAQQLAAQESSASERQADYDQAARLSRMASAQPEEVLRQLEQQLKTNVPMQQEMSQIARSAAEQALEGLEHAIQQQQVLQPALEASDPVMRTQKELLGLDLQHVRTSAQQLLNTLVQETKATARAAKQEPQEQQLAHIEESLRAAQTAASQVGANPTFAALQAAATGMHEALAAAQKSLEQNSQELATATEHAIHQNAADLNNRQREMRDRQRRIQQQAVRNAQQVEREQRQRLSRAEDGLRRAQQSARSASTRLEQLQKQLEKQPEQPAIQAQIAQQAQKLAIARADEAAQQGMRDGLQQRVESAKQDVLQINQEPQLALESQNPSAELSSALASKAAARSQALADSLKQWVEAAATTMASSQQLQDAHSRQQGIGEEVQAAAGDLGRAARHEAQFEQSSHQLGARSTGTVGPAGGRGSKYARPRHSCCPPLRMPRTTLRPPARLRHRRQIPQLQPWHRRKRRLVNRLMLFAKH